MSKILLLKKKRMKRVLLCLKNKLVGRRKRKTRNWSFSAGQFFRRSESDR